MKTKHILVLLFCLLMTTAVEGQIFDILKDALKNKTSEAPQKNTAKSINTAPKRAFYTRDVSIKTFDKQKQSHMSNCFDAEEIAMQSNWTDKKTGKPQTAYFDSEGYFTSYNESKSRHEKTNFLTSGVTDGMAPTIMVSGYKLPLEPFMETSEKFKKQGLKINNFMYLEFAFIYNPAHFRSDKYSEVKSTCREGASCSKFGINEKGYEGSYILFDSQSRLAEINVKVKDVQLLGTNEGKIEYFYNQQCAVNVPAAVEIKMPGQDIFKIE